MDVNTIGSLLIADWINKSPAISRDRYAVLLRGIQKVAENPSDTELPQKVMNENPVNELEAKAESGILKLLTVWLLIPDVKPSDILHQITLVIEALESGDFSMVITDDVFTPLCDALEEKYNTGKEECFWN